jgi:hygromycin-B 7''-O-kinase
VPGVRALAARHGVDGEPVRIPDGSMPVFSVGDGAIFKLFPAPYLAWYTTERAMLERVHGRLGVPTPAVLGAGEEDGHGYVLMSRLAGTPLERAELPLAAREGAMDQLGAAIARLHAVPVDGLPAEDWGAFVERQIAGCVEVQRGRGLAEQWLAQIPAFLSRHRPGPPWTRAVVHTELGPGHVLQEGGALTGIIDWADAIVGDPDFELAAVAIFVARGDRALYRRFMTALGREVPAERAFAYALLHRYSNLRWYLESAPTGGARTLDELAHAWFG